ncbi:TRAP transporter large permease [Paracoccus chinensis]|uniref:TRAP transporter large permease protein n=1 Tax=Paracoccus chinensis TaxID=525640 RepID=A0A1G9KQK6_9RHOB|nr:TRAP transporter large permease [Paracoccus chinensis]SDL51981.1 TRAP transporter, DctM subunit [Paracoccus chinensis]
MTVGLSFLGLLLAGLPISLALAAVALIYIAVSGNLVLLQSYPQQMFGGLENYGMLALPLFILLGEFMNAGGIGRRLMALALAALPQLRGGLAYVNLGANMMMASILGSTVAQITIMARLAVPEMEKAGYPRDVSAAITAAGGLLAPIIPPSMLFIIYGVIAQVPIGEMFVAGILPGVLIFLGFCGLIGWMAQRRDFPRTPRMTRAERLRAVVEALPAALIPLSIIVSILGGFATPTESAVVASLLAILIGLFVYREMTVADIWPALVSAGRGAAVVLFLIASAQVFAWVITFANVPAAVAAWLSGLTDSPVLFLLLLNLLLLGVGMVMDPIPAIILIVPVFLPVATGVYGLDPIHFGIVLCLNLTLGLVTPPVGTGLFTASLLTRVRAERLAALLVPFLAVAFLVILLIIVWPEITLALARWL